MTKHDLRENLINYSVRLLKAGLRLSNIQETNFGVIGHYDITDHCFMKQTKLKYVHIMLNKKYEDKNIHSQILKSNPTWRHLLSPGDKLRSLSQTVQPSYIEEEIEYNYMKDLFSTSVSKRTKDLSTNPMEEGLAILNILESNHITKKAYCIHQLFHNDESLERSWDGNRFPNCDIKSMLLAMEFRTLYKSKPNRNGIIKLSPIKEVNEMMLAYKMQQYKNFEINGRGQTDNDELVESSFKNWIKQLCQNIFDKDDIRSQEEHSYKFYLYCRDFINLKNRPYRNHKVQVSPNVSLHYGPNKPHKPHPLYGPLLLSHEQQPMN